MLKYSLGKAFITSEQCLRKSYNSFQLILISGAIFNKTFLMITKTHYYTLMQINKCIISGKKSNL